MKKSQEPNIRISISKVRHTPEEERKIWTKLLSILCSAEFPEIEEITRNIS